MNRVIDLITQLQLYNLPLITFRRRGLWKFNNSLLNDIEFLDTIKNRILEVKKQYAVTFTIDDQLFLETLMMELRAKCIAYGSYKKSLKIKTE